MACGCPVAAAAAGSLPEVCGDAAACSTRLDPNSIASGIDEALGRSAELTRAGCSRAAAFTWDETARKHDAIYARFCLSAESLELRVDEQRDESVEVDAHGRQPSRSRAPVTRLRRVMQFRTRRVEALDRYGRSHAIEADVGNATLDQLLDRVTSPVAIT